MVKFQQVVAVNMLATVKCIKQKTTRRRFWECISLPSEVM